MILRLMTRGALSLSLFGLVTAGAVALTYVMTEQRIEANEQAVEMAALAEVLPRHDNDLLQDRYRVVGLTGKSDPTEIAVAKQADEVIAFALPITATDGYTGPIDMVLGVSTDGVVTGLRVTQHKETPGLGDKIDLNKSDWVLSFDQTTLNNRNWAPKPDGGDFDAFTGATITPRAVITAVSQTLQWFDQGGKAQLLNAMEQPNG